MGNNTETIKKIGFFPAHPSQFWIMKALYESTPKHFEIHWYIREKDITRNLIDEFGIPYTMVSHAGTGLLGNAVEMLGNIRKFISFSKHHSIDLWLSKYGAVNIAAWLTHRKNLSFNDDDADIVPFIALTSYPFAEAVLCTDWTRMGRYEKRARRYHSFHELFYLHPKRFIPDLGSAIRHLKLNSYTPYAIVRLSSLTAHHDRKIKGVSDYLLCSLIERLQTQYTIFISSERPLKPEFEKYRLPISPIHIHNILAHASIIIGDSQTMVAEAAVLGIPGLRISTFAGQIGYLDELERRGLCVSISPENDGKILHELDILMSKNKADMIRKRLRLLEETVDPVDFFWTQMKKLFLGP
jgi:uncharacterized protein